jgi:hypothetical protein
VAGVHSVQSPDLAVTLLNRLAAGTEPLVPELAGTLRGWRCFEETVVMRLTHHNDTREQAEIEAVEILIPMSKS